MKNFFFITLILGDGPHVFNVRIQDEDRRGGVLHLKGSLIFSTPSQTRSLFISEAEYFWDTDPGEGNATALIAFNGAYDEALEYAMSGSFA